VDANLQRAFQLADRGDWALGTGAAWNDAARLLSIVSARKPTWTEDTAGGEARVKTAPGSVDLFGTRAAVSTDGTIWTVTASGGAPGTTVLTTSTTAISDACVGADGVLYLAIGSAVRMLDLRDRHPDADVTLTGAFRLAAAQPGGVYALTAQSGGSPIQYVHGHALRPLPYEFNADVFRPVQEDVDPPRADAYLAVPDGVTAGAIATSPSGVLALVAWQASGDAELFVAETVAGKIQWAAPITLQGTKRPYSLAWLDEDRVAVLIATATGTTVGVYSITSADQATHIAAPVGDLYPLRDPTSDPFFHGTVPPQYQSTGGVARPLVPVSWPSFAPTGEATSQRLVDGERVGTAWHRLYLEAAIPAGTSIRIFLAASDDPTKPPTDWFEHRFGDTTDVTPGVPVGAWSELPSEMPYHPPLLPCDARPNVAGLFTVLVQRAGRRTRTLAGRYLRVRVQLVGDGRSTPEVAALRIYGGRRAYAGLYLPELYREDTFGTDADAVDVPTPADFLDRFLGAFESMYTPLEDQIANAWVLTTPSRTPDASLDWLASWIGFVFAADLTIDKRRAMLAHAWDLYQRRGTLRGLQLALDLASGGLVTSGAIVVLEDFRLRRTFSTILGVDFTNPGDPLLPGLVVSGNSLVGKTLFVGEEDRAAVLALFAPDLDANDEAKVLAFFDELAFRATVLVHQDIATQDLGLLQQIIDLEAPAHVEVKLVTATYRFRVAVSSLVGIDSFLAPKPAPQPVTLDQSSIGVRDTIQRLPSLDPRLGRS
jgi:phage tail-like protein